MKIYLNIFILMRIKNLKLKCRKRDVVIKITLSLSNIYFESTNYLNNLNFLFFSLSFNNFIKKFII